MYFSRQTCIYKLTRKGEKSKNIARDILKSSFPMNTAEPEL